MQSDLRENSALRGIAVAVLTEHREQQLHIQNRVEATGVARIVFSHPAFPLSATDSIIRQIQDQRTEVPASHLVLCLQESFSGKWGSPSALHWSPGSACCY